MSIKLTYIGSFFDNSGYGVAARETLLSLEKSSKVEVRGINKSFAPNTKKIIKQKQMLIEEICNRNSDDCDVVFMQLTPEQYDQFIPRFKDKIKIGHIAWETTLIPKRWVTSCNNMDGMMVSCNWNVEVLKNSNVTVPVECLHYPLNVNKFDGVKKNDFYYHFKDRLKFYSIFQWTERKNPKGLIRTYLSRFNKQDDVVLILKTYHGNGTIKDTEYLKQEIDVLYNSVNKPRDEMPKLIIISDIMTDEDLLSLHKSCDVYLAPVKGEGFGIPIFDAALAERHIIATNYSSQLDYLDKRIHSLIGYQLEPVHSMPWIPWYFSDQMWASPDLKQLGDKMLFYYDIWKNGNIDEYNGKERNEFAKHLQKEFKHDKIVDKLLKNIEIIKKEIK